MIDTPLSGSKNKINCIFLEINGLLGGRRRSLPFRERGDIIQTFLILTFQYWIKFYFEGEIGIGSNQTEGQVDKVFHFIPGIIEDGNHHNFLSLGSCRVPRGGATIVSSVNM